MSSFFLRRFNMPLRVHTP